MPTSSNTRRAETLDYLRSMLGQLRTMAEGEQLDTLAYLIEMAFVEANDAIRDEQVSRGSGNKQNSAA